LHTLKFKNLKQHINKNDQFPLIKRSDQ